MAFLHITISQVTLPSKDKFFLWRTSRIPYSIENLIVESHKTVGIMEYTPPRIIKDTKLDLATRINLELNLTPTGEFKIRHDKRSQSPPITNGNSSLLPLYEKCGCFLTFQNTNQRIRATRQKAEVRALYGVLV